jgi:hypothetical protein
VTSEQPDQNKPRTYPKSIRNKTAWLLKRNPPPVRDPDQIELPSLPPREPPRLESRVPEVEISTYDKDGNPQRIVVRMNVPQRRYVDYRRFQEPDESGLMAAAIISLFVPCGFFLAIWPAIGARGSAKTVAIISIVAHLVIIFLYVLVMSERRSLDY